MEDIIRQTKYPVFKMYMIPLSLHFTISPKTEASEDISVISGKLTEDPSQDLPSHFKRF